MKDFLSQLRFRTVQALTPRRVVKSRGLKFTLCCDNWITDYRWRTFNEKEPQTLDWIDQKLSDDGVFFDVGANIGIYTIYAALRHPKLKVVALEPEYSNLHFLRDNLIANGLENRVLPFSIALDKQRGISHLHIQDFTPGAALHTVSKESLSWTREGKKVLWKEGIGVWPLDQFCEETGLTPKFMKIDVDGNEREVLEGGMKTISSPHFSSLIVEFQKEKESRNFCEGLLKQASLQKIFEENKYFYQIWSRK